MENEATVSKNFIEQIIEKDLAEGHCKTVKTRFPPEPNGYLHIGHAKSILLNYGLAKKYDGQFNLRFDDTNPTKERLEFVESIEADVKWLGADWADRKFFASNYFDKMYECAVGLIKKGKAYVSDLTPDEIREYRGTLTEAGKELRPYAQNAVNSAEACVDHMNDLKEMLTGELNIGVTFSFSNIMSETLIAFLHAYPHVKLNIQYRTMQELMDGLKKRELDLVLAFKPLKNEKAVDSRAIFSNRLAAIVNVNHPLARLSSVKLSDLERYDLILPCKGLQARNAFDHMVEGKDLNYKIMVEVNNVNIIFDLLSRSNLVTILSESTTILQNGMKAIPIDAPDNEMDGCIHILKDAYMKNSAQEFIRMLSQSTSILANFALKDILR